MNNLLTAANCIVGTYLGWYWRDMKWHHRIPALVVMGLIIVKQIHDLKVTP